MVAEENERPIVRIASVIENDIADSDSGICVSVWFQGCPIHCPGCHNQELWPMDGGEVWDVAELAERVSELLQANGVRRNLSILGGEPFAQPAALAYLLFLVKQRCPWVKVYCWTGHLYEDLVAVNDLSVRSALECIDVLVDGPYMQAKRQLDLPLRGSANQRILRLEKGQIVEENPTN